MTTGLFASGDIPARVYSRRPSYLPFWLACSVGATGGIALAGVTVGELLALAFLPAAVISLYRSRAFRTMALLSLIWCIGALIIDTRTGNLSYSTLQEAAEPILAFAVLAAVLAALRAYRKGLPVVAVAVAVGLLVGAPAELLQGDPWKFGFGLPATLLVFAAMAWRAVKHRTMALMGTVIAMVHLVMGFRSLALIVAVTITLITLAGRRQPHARPSKRISSISIGLTMALAAVLVLTAYSLLAASGTLGEAAELKYEAQSHGSPTALLLSSRSEIVPSVKAVLDSPILGHGTQPVDAARYQDTLLSLRAEGYNIDLRYLDTNQIPTHSYLFDAWSTSGLAGALYWIMAAYIVVKGLRQSLSEHDGTLNPLTALIFVMFCWNLMFSPYAGGHRLLAPLTLAVAIHVTLPPRHPVRPAPQNVSGPRAPKLP